jgi:hypothetical protein
MKKTIWKFQFEVADIFVIEMPKDAEILTIQSQNGNPCMWALVNPEEEKEERHFEMYGTGHDIYYDMGVDRQYIGSFQMLSGDLIFHIFERIN